MINWLTKKIKISELKKYQNNPRKISREELDKLTQSLKEDGYHQRIIVDHDNTMIGGHQRKKALVASGFSSDSEVEVLYPDRPLTEAEIDRINIRDNLNYGEFDFDLLAERFEADTLIDFGMPPEWLKNIRDDELLQGCQEESLIEVKDDVAPIAKLGEVYALGNHRIMCGDSTNPEHVKKLLNGATPSLMVTDPPYGVNYAPEKREHIKGRGTVNIREQVVNDDRYDWSKAYSLFVGDVAYVWHAYLYTHDIIGQLKQLGFVNISLIVWAKQHFAIGRSDYHPQTETCWYVVRKGKSHNWQGRRDQSNLWQIQNNNAWGGKNKEALGHPTQKPIECMLRPILNSSAVGDVVYDPFCGSGTTLIACERSNRICYAMELEPKYVDMAIARWEKERNNPKQGGL